MNRTDPHHVPSPLAAAVVYPLRALACIPVAAVYLFVKVLARVVPHRPPEARPDSEPAGAAPKFSAFPIRWSVALYRFSLFHDLMHRRGERCMFLPTCTDYAQRVGETRGLIEGLRMIGDRFRRCRADTTENFLDFP